MYVSRLSFFIKPGHTEDVARRLRELADMVAGAGGKRPRILRVSMASPGAPDLQFEQEIESLAELEREMSGVTDQERFRQWSQDVSSLVLYPPKREILTIE